MGTRRNVDKSIVPEGVEAPKGRRKRGRRVKPAAVPVAADAAPVEGAQKMALKIVEAAAKPNEKWRPEFVRMAKEACRLGASNSDLAALLGVTRQCINRWTVEKPAFAKAVKLGKKVADDRIERSLYERAFGYEYEKDEIKVVGGELVIVPTKVQVPADPHCLMFWLSNRRKNQWQNRQQVEVSDGAEGLAERMKAIKAKRAAEGKK